MSQEIEVSMTLNLTIKPIQLTFEHHDTSKSINGAEWLALDELDREDYILVGEEDLLRSHCAGGMPVNIIAAGIDFD